MSLKTQRSSTVSSAEAEHIAMGEIPLFAWFVECICPSRQAASTLVDDDNMGAFCWLDPATTPNRKHFVCHPAHFYWRGGVCM